MGCFDNLVSLREYCTAVVPTSGIYLNDLGLSRSLVEDIITGDYATVKSLVDATISSAMRDVVALVNGKFSSRIKTHSAIESGVVGVPDGSNEVVAGGGYRGIQAHLYNSGNYLNFQLASLSLHLDFSGSVDVLIYDLNTNTLLDTIPVTAIAGQVVNVYPQKVYSSHLKNLNLWIGYESTGIDSYKTVTRSTVCCGNFGRKTEYLSASGQSVSGDFISSNLTSLTTTSGISINYSIWCDSEGWLCSYARLIATPVAHKGASEIYRRGMMVSPLTRTNNTTITNPELMKANFEWHIGNYEAGMKMLLNTVHLPNNTACFQCESRVSHKIILP